MKLTQDDEICIYEKSEFKIIISIENKENISHQIYTQNFNIGGFIDDYSLNIPIFTNIEEDSKLEVLIDNLNKNNNIINYDYQNSKIEVYLLSEYFDYNTEFKN